MIFQGANFIAPSSITETVSASPADDEDDVAVFNDGNTYTIPDVGAANPAVDIDFVFTNVRTLYGLSFRAYYNGTAAHYYEVAIKDTSGGGSDIVIAKITDDADADFNYRTILIPFVSDFISGGTVEVSFIHRGGVGNANDDLVVEFIALIGLKSA